MEETNHRYQRPNPKYNDIDLSRWKDYSHILTDSLWNISDRAKENGHRLDYHGNFIPQIATQTYLRYTKTGDCILDLFMGSGTAAVEAVNLNRSFIGMELKQELVDYVKSKISPENLDKSVFLHCCDSTEDAVSDFITCSLKHLNRRRIQMLVLHPPYADIIKFSDDPRDLSNTKNIDEFLSKFSKAARIGYNHLESGRFAVLVIGDKYGKSELVPLGFLCMTEMNKVGFKTKSIVVKNIENNEKGKGKFNNLWRFRALRNGFYIFKHEYIMIFQK